jgi:hypothetical protein
MKPFYAASPRAQLAALVQSAGKLRSQHGDWKIPYGSIHRAQRRENSADLLDLPFDDRRPSLPSVGGHGPMGVILTQYYSPTLYIPYIKELKNKYGLIGATYLGVYEFGDRVEGATVLHFGQSGDPTSGTSLIRQSSWPSGSSNGAVLLDDIRRTPACLPASGGALRHVRRNGKDATE